MCMCACGSKDWTHVLKMGGCGRVESLVGLVTKGNLKRIGTRLVCERCTTEHQSVTSKDA